MNCDIGFLTAIGAFVTTPADSISFCFRHGESEFANLAPHGVPRLYVCVCYQLISTMSDSAVTGGAASTFLLHLTLRLLSYIYMELLVKPEMLTSYIYEPTFGNAETVSIYLLHNVSTLNQCREVSCVTFVCKHFAS